MSTLDALVIGAGVAGLTTAREPTATGSPSHWSRRASAGGVGVTRARLGGNPAPFREKNPNRKQWGRERYTTETIPAAFKHAGGIGIINGRPSNGAVNIDPDGRRAAAAWESYRLETHLRHGRASGYIHDFYIVDKPPPTEHLKDPVHSSPLFDFLSDGSQVVVPHRAVTGCRVARLRALCVAARTHGLRGIGGCPPFAPGSSCSHAADHGIDTLRALCL